MNNSKTQHETVYLCYLPNLCALVSFQLSVSILRFAMAHDVSPQRRVFMEHRCNGDLLFAIKHDAVFEGLGMLLNF